MPHAWPTSQSAPAARIDGTAAVHRCSRPHSNSWRANARCRNGPSDRPGPQNSTRPDDAPGGIIDISAIDQGARSMVAEKKPVTSSSSSSNVRAIEKLHFAPPFRSSKWSHCESCTLMQVNKQATHLVLEVSKRLVGYDRWRDSLHCSVMRCLCPPVIMKKSCGRNCDKIGARCHNPRLSKRGRRAN